MSGWIRAAGLVALTQATLGCWGATASDPNGASGPRGSAASAGQGAAIGISGGANAVDSGGAGSSGLEPGGAPSARGGASVGGIAALLGGAGPASGGNAGHCPDQPPTEALIDDMESGAGRILGNEGRVGVWYAFNDQTDPAWSTLGTQWPAPAAPGVPIPTSLIPGGRGCSGRAMHSYGDGFEYWGAGIGFDLGFDGQSYRTYDASAYAGITFWARGLPETIMQVRVSTAVTTRAEWGGTCPQELCPYPYHTTLSFGSEWTQYWIPFASLHQSDWAGAVSFEQTELTNIQFFVPGPSQLDLSLWPYDYTQNFDFWVDDVAFYADPAPCCSPLPACQGVIGFADPQLEQSVRAAINRPTGALACRDVCSAYVLTGVGPNLGGIECLANLTVLTLGATLAPVDLSPLSNLVHLTNLQVASAGVKDLGPLSGLANLATLSLASNQISDLGPLGSLTDLVALNLVSNEISDLSPLATLTNLTRVYLGNNRISDASPLLGLPRLVYLDLDGNPVCCHSQDATLVALKERGVVSNNCTHCN